MKSEDPDEPAFERAVDPLMGGGNLGGAERHWRSEVDAEAEESEPGVDIASNELRAGVGEKCARCGQPIQSGEDVRRTALGAYQHENCEAPALG